MGPCLSRGPTAPKTNVHTYISPPFPPSRPTTVLLSFGRARIPLFVIIIHPYLCILCMCVRATVKQRRREEEEAEAGEGFSE